MFKAPSLNKKKKEKDNTKKWKGFSVPLNRFELDDDGDLKMIGNNFEAFNVSESVTEMWCIGTKLLNY